MRKAVLLVVAVLLQVGFALTRAYSVEPVKQEWSGFTDTIFPYDRVSQIVTCCWDSLEYCELFVGERGNGGAYRAGVRLDDNELMWSSGNNVPQHGWVKFENWSDSTYEFTKGKQYEFRFTRSGSESDLVGLDCGPADATMA